MAAIAKCGLSICVLLCVASPGWASSCAPSIVRVQAMADAAIENNAGSHGWQRESVNATRNYQPTPRSLAATEGVQGLDLEAALDLLDRARAADGMGNATLCQRHLATAQAILRAQQR